MTWIRWYAGRIRAVGRAALWFLRDGDERRFEIAVCEHRPWDGRRCDECGLTLFPEIVERYAAAARAMTAAMQSFALSAAKAAEQLAQAFASMGVSVARALENGRGRS